MVTKQDIDEFIEAVLKKHNGNRNSAFREMALRTIHFHDEKERLEKEVEKLKSELMEYKTGSVNE